MGIKPVPHIYAAVRPGGIKTVAGAACFEIGLEDGTSFRLPGHAAIQVAKMQANDLVLIDLRNWDSRKIAYVFIYRQRTDSFGMNDVVSFMIGEKCALISPAIDRTGT